MGCGASRAAPEAVSAPAPAVVKDTGHAVKPAPAAAESQAAGQAVAGNTAPSPGGPPTPAQPPSPTPAPVKPSSRPPSAKPPSRPPSAKPASPTPPPRPPSGTPTSRPDSRETRPPAPPSRPASASAPAPTTDGILDGGSQDPLAASRLGITLRGLRRLVARLQQRFGPEGLAAMSTSQVMLEYVQAVTRPRRCRLLEMAPEEVQPEDVRPPQYFISHAWKNRASRLFQYVLGYLQDAEDSVSVWIDILAVNQHAGTQAQLHDVSPEAFSATVRTCSAGTLVVLDTEACSPASRAWCIFEWTHTLLLHGPDGLHLHLRPEDRSELFRSVDVESAQCFEPADKAMILGEVAKYHSSPAAFNAKLRLQLLLEPLSYRVDIRRLSRQAEETGTVWDFGAVDAWLAEGGGGGGGAGAGGDGSSRVLCMAAGAGEGKSTVSAALCARGGAGGGAAAVAAYHFVKYNDQRRLEPVRVVKSLAYQLAERLPAVCEHLLQLDVAEVATLTDVEQAFTQLLLRPLEAHFAAQPADAGRQQIVILIDALDEADPPELLRAAAGGGGGGDGGAPVCPTVCGNFALQLLVGQLRQLPPAVRFIVTTRPDAAAGQVLPCLERAFPGGVTKLAPAALRKAGGGAAAGGGGVLVYHTAAAALQAAAAAAAGGVSLPPPLAGAPRLEDVFDMYSRVFDLAARAGGGGEEAAPHALLPQLLEVLLAAREPLSESFLQQMGLGGALRVLPGAPHLFFLEEHHLYTAHRTLDEWLLRGGGGSGGGGSGGGGGGGPFSVRVARGHEAIGLRLATGVWQASSSPSGAAGGGGASGSTVAAVPYMLPYTLKYVVAHLAAAAEGAADDGEGDGGDSALPLAGPAAAALDVLLCDFAFIQAVIAAGHAPAVVGVLAAMRRRTAVSYDALRWLQAEQFNLAGRTPRAAALHALATVPVGSVLHAAAAAAAGLPWATRRVLPDAGGWAQSQMVLKGHPDKVLCIAFSPDSRQLASSGEDDETIRIWDTRTGRCTATLVGHAPGRSVRSVAFSPDGRRLASGGDDGAALLWDAATGQVTATLAGHDDGVFGVAFSPDGARLASCGGDRAVRVWQLDGGGECACVAVLEGHTDTVRCVAWSHDGRQLASGSEDWCVRLWHAETGECMGCVEGYEDDVNAVAFSADDLTLASCGSDGKVLLYDVAMGEAETLMELGGGEVKCLAFSADGARMASSDQAVRLWRVADWSHTGNLQGGSGYMQSVAFSPDGRVLAAGRSDATVRIWELPDGGGAAAAGGGGDGGPTDVVRHLSLSAPDGQQLAVASKDGSLRVWDTRRGNLVGKAEGAHEGGLTDVAFSPVRAGVLATAGHDGVVRLWDTTDHLAELLPPGLRNSRFSPAEQVMLLAAAGLPVERLLGSLEAGPRCTAKLEGHGCAVACVAFRPDGKLLASGGRDGGVRVWDAEGGGGCVAELLGHADRVGCVAFSADGRALASAGGDKIVRVWDVAARECVAQLAGHGGAIGALAWRPGGGGSGGGGDEQQGLLVSGGDDKVVRVWDVGRGTCIAELRAAVRHSPTLEELTAQGDFSFLAINSAMASQFRGNTYGLAFSPDGSVLVSADNDEMVRVWEVGRWECVAELPGHKETLGGVACVAFSPDGTVLASGGMDQTVRLWRATAGA